MDSLRRIRRVLLAIFSAIIVVGLGAALLISWTVPSDPDPSTGRTYELHWQHGVGYVTDLEGRLIQILSNVGVLAFLIVTAALFVTGLIERRWGRPAAGEAPKIRTHARRSRT
ncbi:MAG TPA: hypothetical protein VJN67_14480 [Stellaceae bacterium]|nr:hypothetical protein [Stellaceae bacterium]